MAAYRHYADYIVKRAMSDLGSIDDFLRHVLFTDALWQRRVMGFGKEIRGFEGTLQREDLNKAIKQETLDGGFLFHNARVIVEGGGFHLGGGYLSTAQAGGRCSGAWTNAQGTGSAHHLPF